jgi:thioredoxin reductase (NADPH)
MSRLLARFLKKFGNNAGAYQLRPRFEGAGKVHTDCLVIGGGPAGLAAAIYLARFRLRTMVIDAGRSRAALIARSHNHAGFPNGISGKDLLGRMREQALRYDADLRAGHVQQLTKRGEEFVIETDSLSIAARTVLLATGVTNLHPQIPREMHDEALMQGQLRYCPVCDGYEACGQNIAVIGTGVHGAKEAEFLRAYSDRVTLIAPDGAHELRDSERARLAALRVRIVDGPVRDFALTADRIGFTCAAGELWFDTMYPALGSKIHSELAIALGADCSEEGCIRVDSHQATSVPGLFAAGDVVLGLDQISHAIGEAGVAATAMRNMVAASQPLLFEGRTLAEA